MSETHENHLTFEPRAGSHISSACKEAVAISINSGSNVAFSFNGIRLLATPDSTPKALEVHWSEAIDEEAEAYRKSPAGVAAAKARTAEIKQNQDTITAAFKSLPGILALKESDILNGKTRLDLGMGWLHSFTHHSDDIANDWDKAAGVKNGKEWLRVLLMSAGYRENECVGETPESLNTPDKMGRYIIGQVIACLSAGMGPHPIVIEFIRKYHAMKSEPTHGNGGHGWSERSQRQQPKFLTP